jgi:ATP-dependent RNA/DNA helicase IGHMBP2
MDDSIIHQFCAEQRELLQLELLQSETSTSEQQQNVLHGLQVHDLSVGLYGRTIVYLSKQSNLPAHRFTTGDEVEIRGKHSSTGGVIHHVTEESISVALFRTTAAAAAAAATTTKNKKSNNNFDTASNNDDEEDVIGSPPLSLLPKSSIEVHQKLLSALEELEQHGTDHPVAGTVIQTVFEQQSDLSTTTPIQFPLDSTHLDDSQRDAIQLALQQPVALLHGPPGSGKTTTVVELIRQAVFLHQYRVLVTAPSHVAVDNILSRLVTKGTNQKKQPKLQVVRLGHPARLQADLLPYSLEALVQAAEGTEIVQDVRHELQTWLRRVNRPQTKYADKVAARREMKLLRQEIKQREQKVVHDLFQRANVVLATCVGAANRLLSKNTYDRPFDLVIVDEAAQSLEAACWIPILRGSRLVLAGDHCQLPPTIQCNDRRVQQKLGHTMFARIMKLYETNPHQISRMLKVQYRMHETIANWASEALYHGELTTHSTAQGRTLATLPGVSLQDDEDNELAQMPLLLIDTAGCDCYESTNAAGSRFNPGEAHIVQQHVRRLLDMGVPASQIAVITPYNGQVELLKSMEMPVEIRTVDGFQGGEREAVVLSLVRSSPQKGSSIGFLRDDRRLNVAVTRAKRHCCVVADSETVSSSPFVKNLIEWIEHHGEQRSAMDYMADDTNTQLGQDLLEAQLELQQYLQSGANTENGGKSKKAVINAGVANNKKDKVASSTDRDALLERVRTFHKTGKAGNVLSLSRELSKGDRHAIHELAEELGLLHISSGTEGIDRRMTLSLPLPESNSSVSLPEPNSNGDPTTAADSEQYNITATTVVTDDLDETDYHEPEASLISAFHVLQEGDDDKSASEDEKQTGPIETQVTMNPLALLAKEREQREKDRKAQQSDSTVTGNKTSKKTKNGKKVGSLATSNQRDIKGDKTDENIEDDMAFLDAQINKVQNSHGRKVIGKGSSYRTIVNGILLAKPKPVEKKSDPRAASALQAKLKQAENNRKAKTKPKKK